MTDSRGTPRDRRTPQQVRFATFSQRKRGGWDPDEVREFLAAVADDIQLAGEERARLVAENERLRAALVQASTPEAGDRTEANNQAIALLSQAQLVADQLVADHEQHSQNLVSNARARQRELMDSAPGSALPAALEGTRGYVVPVPEIEYVRTYTQIAQGQLRSVLQALSEQVDRLGELPRLDEGNNHHNGRNSR
jgi:DivIVA domain-containing protein